MSKKIVITGASSGFGAMTARALADAGHTVYASMRDVGGRNEAAAADAAAYARDHGVDLRTVELDVADDASVERAIATVTRDAGGLDVVVHNAGHMVLGPTEAFTPEQLAVTYDTNVLSTQRVNRAVLPVLREQRDGLLVWVGSTSTRGGTPPYLAPYFAAKAAMDSLAVSYAAELARFGIDTTIIVPGSFTHGTNHFAHAGHARDADVAAEYEERYAGLMDQVAARLAALAPADADPEDVARQIVRVVDLPKGERPFRVHIDPANDGAEEVNAIGDRVRARFYERIGLVGKYQARIVAANVLGEQREAHYEAVPRVTFTDPQAAAVGAVDDAFSATVRLSDVAKTATHTRACAESNGYVTPLSDGERISGAHALGPDAGEWLRQATLAIRARVPLDVLADTIQPFPTFSEVYLGGLRALNREIAPARPVAEVTS